MQSIHDLVCSINNSFELPSETKLFGIAYTMIKDLSTGERIPVQVIEKGEGVPVVPDDGSGIQIYHKLNIMNTTRRKSAGRSNDIVNTYNMQMVVFLNRVRTNMLVDELLVTIQSQLPETIALQPYSAITLSVSSAILNDLSVWQQEYNNSFRLTAEQNLFLLNYQIETVFSKSCFNRCPEVEYS